MRSLAPCLALAVVLAACGGFKSTGGDGGADAGGDGAAGGEGGAEAGGGMTGPGPRGALPTGYCCASNDDCRYRKCVDFGGSKMCADECSGQDACDGNLPNMQCVGATMFDRGTCQPKTQGTQCVPAAQFTYGAKKLGQCCTPTWNGASGNECEGGHCGQFGNDPFMCTQACAKPADCPGDFQCVNVSNGYNICAPGPSATQCKP